MLISNTHLQNISPRGGIIYDGFHGPLKAMNYVDAGHSLKVLGKLLYYSWCDSCTTTMMHLFQAFRRDGAARKCWGRHFSFLILWQLRVKMRWLHMRKHLPSPLSYMAASMILIMIPYVENVLTLGNMVGGEAHWWDVSLVEGVPHSFFTACFNGRMRYYMATMVYHLSPCEVGHMFVGDMPLLCIREEFFYGLPRWEVIHFISMIAWRWESFMNNGTPHDFHHLYLEEAMDQ